MSVLLGIEIVLCFVLKSILLGGILVGIVALGLPLSLTAMAMTAFALLWVLLMGLHLISHGPFAVSFAFVLSLVSMGLWVFATPPLRRACLDYKWRGIRLEDALYALFKPAFEKGAELQGPIGELGSPQGMPLWQQGNSRFPTKLSPEEQAFLEHQVVELCKRCDEWQKAAIREEGFSSVQDYLRQEKFFGLSLSKRYGGWAFSEAAQSAIVLEIAKTSLATAMLFAAHPLDWGTCLERYGTEAQKQHYLPRLATGEETMSFVGTRSIDASEKEAKGIVGYGFYEGQEVLGIHLTFDGANVWLAPLATCFGVVFRLFDPEQLLELKPSQWGWQLAFIPASHAGVDVSERHASWDPARWMGSVTGAGVFVPLEGVLGGAGGLEQGWPWPLEYGSVEESVALSALATAMAERAFRTTVRHIQAQGSSWMGQSGECPAPLTALQRRITRMRFLLSNLESTRRFTSSGLPQELAVLAKRDAFEGVRQIVWDAMDIQGVTAARSDGRPELAFSYQSLPFLMSRAERVSLPPILLECAQLALQGRFDARQRMVAASRIAATENGSSMIQVFWSEMGAWLTRWARGVLLGWIPNGVLPIRWQLARDSGRLSVLSDYLFFRVGGDTLHRKAVFWEAFSTLLNGLYGASALLCTMDGSTKEARHQWTRWGLKYHQASSRWAFRMLLTEAPLPLERWLLRVLLFPWGLGPTWEWDAIDPFSSEADFETRLTVWLEEASEAKKTV